MKQPLSYEMTELGQQISFQPGAQQVALLLFLAEVCCRVQQKLAEALCKRSWKPGECSLGHGTRRELLQQASQRAMSSLSGGPPPPPDVFFCSTCTVTPIVCLNRAKLID